MTFLTTQKAKEWKAGRWKHSYTNFYPPKNGLFAVSGDYAYIIRFTGLPHVVSFNRVPKGYRSCVKATSIIYKTPAKLIRVVQRDLRKGRTLEGK